MLDARTTVTRGVVVAGLTFTSGAWAFGSESGPWVSHRDALDGSRGAPGARRVTVSEADPSETAPPAIAWSSARFAEPSDTGPDRTPLAWLAGALPAMVGLALGSAIALESRTVRNRSAGTAVALTGLAVAPLTAHAVVDEPGRGLWFSLVPSLGAATMVAYAAGAPDEIRTTATEGWIATTVSALTLAAAAIGVLDASMAKARRASGPTARPGVVGWAWLL